MASFFDATATAHLALVTRSLRSHQDLAVEAARAERDVIAVYTLRATPMEAYSTQFYAGRGYAKGNGVYVCLEGFDPDADNVTDTELKEALRDSIVDVLNWRLAKYGESPLLLGIGTAIGVSKGFREDANRQWPVDWDWRLGRWDLRPPQTVIG